MEKPEENSRRTDNETTKYFNANKIGVKNLNQINEIRAMYSAEELYLPENLCFM